MKRLYTRKISCAGTMVTAKHSVEENFRDRVSRSLQMGQCCIKESAKNCDEAIKANMKMLMEEIVDDEDNESPMVPQQMPHLDDAIMDNCLAT